MIDSTFQVSLSVLIFLTDGFIQPMVICLFWEILLLENFLSMSDDSLKMSICVYT